MKLEEALNKISFGSKKIKVMKKYKALGVWVLDVNGMPIAVDAKEAKKLFINLECQCFYLKYN